jgi:sec-independent protein translocase protein TatB
MNLGFSGEIIFIMLLALILFGPRRLPELARQAGKLMAEFRKASENLQNQIQAEVEQLELDKADPVKSLAPAVAEAKSGLEDVSLTGAFNRLTDGLTNISWKTPAAPVPSEPSDRPPEKVA